jgi:hypothetical protein
MTAIQGYSSFEEFRKIRTMLQMAREQVADDARERGHALGGTIADMPAIEAILGGLHTEYAATGNDRGLMGLGMLYGLYLGEVIQQVHGKGQWNMHHAVLGANTFPLEWPGHGILPVVWCWKRIFDGPSDDITAKYQLAFARDRSG